MAEYVLMSAGFEVQSNDLKRQYEISAFPTVILFVNGQVRQRWVLDYDLDHYRKALDAVLAEGAATRPWSRTGKPAGGG
jgi:hypothetical protein